VKQLSRRRLSVALAALVLGAAHASAQQKLGAAGLTAFRPQNRTGYAPFARTAVPDAKEEDPLLGPGIRRNGAGETDPATEDDLIEVVVQRGIADTDLVLERSGPALAVWTTRTKQAGTELAFTNDRTGPLPIGAGLGAKLTVWVEWTGAVTGLGAIVLKADEGDGRLDRLVFHPFHNLVVALGGESQTPGLPLDPNHGTFVVGTELYEQGYDVLMRDEDEVSSDGSGPVYTEVVNAIQHRSVGELAIYGYSHGGGSTYDLCERLDAFHASIGVFAIPFTSYVDGVQNDSDTDLDMETRKPIATGYHANHYQHGTFADFFLDGGPVTSSNPAPTGLDVETIFWGVGATHFLVDDYIQVESYIYANLVSRMDR